jgi:hypothetical protein
MFRNLGVYSVQLVAGRWVRCWVSKPDDTRLRRAPYQKPVLLRNQSPLTPALGSAPPRCRWSRLLAAAWGWVVFIFQIGAEYTVRGENV